MQSEFLTESSRLAEIVQDAMTRSLRIPNSAIALGGRKAFLVSAALDGAKLPVLDTADDGFAVMVETAGDHVRDSHWRDLRRSAGSARRSV